MRTVGRWLYAIFALLFLISVIAQFYFAGMAVFGEPRYWMQHTSFVHLFGLNLPILMLLSAFAGAARKWEYAHILVLLFLVIVMYFTANLGVGRAWIGSLHPIAGVLMATVAVSNLYRAIQFAKNQPQKEAK